MSYIPHEHGRTYRVSFTGRKAGAIGITYKIEVFLKCLKKDIIDILYREYEHIGTIFVNGKELKR